MTSVHMPQGKIMAHSAVLSSEVIGCRHASVNSLMYVKEDYIIPHHVSFHDLIRKKVKGKTGPLFDFGVHDDVRMHSDARIQNSESHAGKSFSLHVDFDILSMPQTFLKVNDEEDAEIQGNYFLRDLSMSTLACYFVNICF